MVRSNKMCADASPGGERVGDRKSGAGLRGFGPIDRP
jgi:hypothetical protein